jgi:uncharacterized lipoprotein YddW (UPF0748 family)
MMAHITILCTSLAAIKRSLLRQKKVVLATLCLQMITLQTGLFLMNVNAQPVQVLMPSDSEPDQIVGKAQLNKAGQRMPMRGMWVEAVSDLRVLDSKAGIVALLEDAAHAQVTDLFIQVYKAGKGWYRSTIARPAQFIDEIDPLALVLDGAEKRGIRVHAWINMFNLADNNEAAILQMYGDEVLIEDNRGTASKAYLAGTPPDERAPFFRLDTPGLWLDPAHPAVKRFTLRVIEELLRSYPTLTGVHLDYFRYPYLIPARNGSSVPYGFDFGYGVAAREQFAHLIGNPTPFERGSLNELQPVSAEIATLWDRWRREQIESYLPQIRGFLRKDQLLSVASVASTDKAFNTVLQNWPRWVEHGEVDLVALMSYTQDEERFRQFIKQALSFRNRGTRQTEIIAGIGAWQLSQYEISSQSEAALELGAQGTLLFSYANMKKQAQRKGENSLFAARSTLFGHNTL